MYTKRDLELKFKISDNTVYRTMQVCGIDTSKHEYTDEEIEQFFIPARKLLDARKSYKEVKARMEMRRAGIEDEDFDQEEVVVEEAGDAAATVSLTVAQTVQEMVASSVKEVMPFVPALVAQSFSQELNSEEMKAAFGQMRSQMKGTGAGAVFLKQQLAMNRNRLNAATPRLTLPSASPEASPENSPSSSENS